MRIEKLRMRSFRRFEDATAEFSPGLNLIQGDNNAGKSSMLHAVYYALTGKPLGMSSASEYISFQENRLKVDLTFTTGDDRYRIHREYSHSNNNENNRVIRLQEDKKTRLEDTSQGANISDINTLVQKLTGISKRALDTVNYAKQQEFVRKIEGNRRTAKRLDKLFGFDKIGQVEETVSEVTDDRRQEVETKLPQKKQKKGHLREQLEEAQDKQKSLEEDAQGLENEINEDEEKLQHIDKRTENLKAKKNKLEKLVQVVQKLDSTTNVDNPEQRAEELSQETKELEEEIQNLKEKIEEAERDAEARQRARNHLRQAENKMHEAARTLFNAEKQLDDLGNLEDRLPKQPLEKVQKELDEKLQQQRKRCTALSQELEGLEEVLESGECDRCGRPIEDYGSYKQKVEEIEQNLNQAREKKNNIEQRKAEVEDLRENLKTKNELEEEKQEAEEKLEEAQTKRKEAQDTLEDTDEPDVEALREKKSEKEKRLARKKEKKQSLEREAGELSHLEEKRRNIEEKMEDVPEDPEESFEQVSENLSKLQRRQRSLETSIQKDKEKLQDLRERASDRRSKAQEHEKKLEDIKSEIKELEALHQRVKKVEEALEIYSEAGNAVREDLATKLESKVFEWYKKLAASHEFKKLRIDPEDYQLRGVPDGADQKYSISDYQGGGQRTLTALAYQLAIAESTGRTSILMIDEPTDATDSDNRSRLLEMIHQAVDNFNQIILITHHGAGREKAEHIIQIDKDGDTSKIQRPIS